MRIRAAVRENRLSDPASIAAADYRPFIDAGCCWVWEESGAALGFAALDAAGASVWALFVAPDAEGRGIGRALLDRLVAEARELRLPHLILETGEHTRAETLYRRTGWTPVTRDGKGNVTLRLEL